jgi:copper chaperone NosL
VTLALVAATAAIVAAAVLLIVRAQRVPDGPEPVAWDREACAHCHMLIGDVRFGAQLITKDGRVHNFDDPGCMLRYVAEYRPAVHAMWFRHVDEDRWVRGDQVAFRRVADSPMDWGLGAVGADQPHDLDRAGAEAEVNASASRDGGAR